MRCLVKMILKEPAENGKDYKWYEMTLLSHWDALAETHQILCIDTEIRSRCMRSYWIKLWS